MQRASLATMIFLVLLRLAIGWHFLFEGLQKVESRQVGETASNRPFSSAGYFREATGPLGGVMRLALGDPDIEALARLRVKPLPAGEEPSRLAPHLRTPPALAQDWERYLARFEKHYDLGEKQREEAHKKLEQAEDTVVLWLTQEEPDATTPEQKISFPSGDVLRRVPTAERIQQYRDRRKEVRDVLGRKTWLFGRDVEKARLRQARAEVAQLRTGLMRDLDRHTQALMSALNFIVVAPVVTPVELLEDRLVDGEGLLRAPPRDSKTREALKTLVGSLKGLSDDTRGLWPVKPEEVGAQGVAPLDATALRERLTSRAEALNRQAKVLGELAQDERLKKYAADVQEDTQALVEGVAELPGVGPMTVEVPSRWTLEWLDRLTSWGLTILGACLMLGLLSRTNSWLAAAFLLLTYLAMPSFPWLPAPPQSEGNYLFINKNVIEMLALCVLGTIPTGRWFGLDAVPHWIFGKHS